MTASADAAGSDLPSTASTNPEPRPVTDVTPAFRDVAEEAGITFAFFSDTVPDRFFLPEVMGGGAAWLDFDNDDVLDLYLMNGSALVPGNGPDTPHVNQLYRGKTRAKFRPVGRESGTDETGYGQGCAAGDYNADGFADLYLGNFGANALLVNNGDGTFSEVSESAGVADDLWTTSVVWHDVDGDMDLDLYVTNYLNATKDNIRICDYGAQKGYCGPGQYDAVPDHVYLNQGEGSFVEASRDLGLTGNNGKGLAVVVTDLDGDRRAEIYVANDMSPNCLYARKPGSSGKTEFQNVAEAAGCAQSGEGMNEASMGIACADFDGDTRYDIYLTHYYQMKNTLYRNLGGLIFDDASLRLGAATAGYEYLGFGTAPLDFDRDGWPDLFITNGHVLGPNNPPYKMTGQLLHNRAGQRFEDISASAGPYFSRKLLGRGVAATDFDSDGDTDLLVTHVDDPVALLSNETETAGGFVGFELRTASRICPVGALVRITSADFAQQQQVVVGGSYLCSHDQRLLFGWRGIHETVDVEVQWPSGTTERFSGLATERYWVLTEGALPR